MVRRPHRSLCVCYGLLLSVTVRYRYDGPTFLSTLDALPVLERNHQSALRLPILSKYKDLGTIIEGKVEQGTVAVGDKLCIMPNRTPVEVMNVWLDQDEVCV